MLKVMSIELVTPSNHLILCHPLLLLSSIFPSIRVFANDSVLSIRWPKYWNSASSLVHSMNIQDRFPLGLTDMISLQSKGLSRVFQSSKASILWFLPFLIVQLSHPYVTTGKIMALTIWTFVGKVMSLSRFVIRSVTQSCPTLCDPMNRSMPGLPVHHQLPEFTQTHVL